MLTRAIFAAAGLALASPAQAQWATTGNNIYNTNTGLVGVGTSSPTKALLQINSGAALGLPGIWSDTATGSYSIMGHHSATSGNYKGVYGWSDSTGGFGVFGWAAANTGLNYGVWGQTDSDSGHAVHALYSSTTGGGMALAAVSNADTAYAVFSLGGKNYFQKNVGLNTQTPSAQLDVVGTVKFETLATSTSVTQLVAIDGSGNLTRQNIPVAPPPPPPPPTMSGVKDFRGNGTWTKPSGITRVKCKVWGGGGGGNIGAQTAGGAGAYVEAVLDVSGTSSLSIVVGGGGGDGGGGGNSSVVSGSTTMILAGGGGGGGGFGNGGGGTPSVDASVTNYTAWSGHAGLASTVFTRPPYQGPYEVVPYLLSGSSNVMESLGTGGKPAFGGNPGCVILEW